MAAIGEGLHVGAWGVQDDVVAPRGTGRVAAIVRGRRQLKGR